MLKNFKFLILLSIVCLSGFSAVNLSAQTGTPWSTPTPWTSSPQAGASTWSSPTSWSSPVAWGTPATWTTSPQATPATWSSPTSWNSATSWTTVPQATAVPWGASASWGASAYPQTTTWSSPTTWGASNAWSSSTPWQTSTSASSTPVVVTPLPPPTPWSNATSTPTATSSIPTLVFTADPLSVVSGGVVTLTWNSTNATSCIASGSWGGVKNVSGSEQVSPTVTSVYSLRCTGLGGSVTKSATVTVTQTQDNTPPEVSITSPASGATVSGTNVTLSANATDNLALVGVQFKLNNQNIGSEDSIFPYSIIWNSNQVSNGTYSLVAIARDVSGNRATSSQISITVSNTVSVPTFKETLLVNGLNTPTSMEFSPDGRLFVAEKGGSLRVIKNGALLPAPFLSLSVSTESERGLLGIAFDPNFASNRYVYVYYTRVNSPIKNRVSRFTASFTNPDLVESSSEVVILDDIASDAGNHNGGAIHFGLDGKLYIGVGDGGTNSGSSQSMSTLSGKLLRINSNGTVPSDNPFVGVSGARGEIWALGLRNPFTFAVDPVSGVININDVGASTYEEINRSIRGANFGWPSCEGPCSISGYTNPIHFYGRTVGRSITGGAFYRKAQFPSSYNGVYFFGDYLGGFIKYLSSSGQAIDWRSAKSPVDIKIGPDGALYYASIFDGAIYKVSYSI